MVTVAVGQLCSKASMASNLAQCKILVGKAVAAGAKALFLPEASDYIANSSEESLKLAKSIDESEFVQGIRSEARSARLPINVGIHEPTEGNRLKNTLLWIDADGEITQRYQKVHLFNADIPNGPVLRESDSVEPGKRILPPFDTVAGRVGLMICFDLRFPEISLSLRRQGSQILAYPSAFTVPTGKAHWEILLRARAIETQSYVVAAAQAGSHSEKRVSYGHSMIVSPWGEVMASLGEQPEPEIAVADIDLDSLEHIRRNIELIRRTYATLSASGTRLMLHRDVYPEM